MKNDIRYQVEFVVDPSVSDAFVTDNEHENMEKVAAVYEAKRMARGGQSVRVVRIQRSIVAE